MVKSYIVERGSWEWDHMWAKLGAKRINKNQEQPTVCCNPENYECWQYMGTYQGRHEFRHRWHPVTGKREYITIAIRNHSDLIEL